MTNQMARLALCWAVAAGPVAAQAPVLTDEFDRIVVTAATEPGSVIGQIRLVFPSAKPVRWSLIKPVPGGDRRGYLRPGQKDATTIVSIDSATGQLRLLRRPDVFPQTLYAEVRATNDDGSMDEVLIVMVLQEAPRRERALEIFTQERTAPGIRFLATAGVAAAKVEHAVRVANALLSKDRRGSNRISRALAATDRIMTIFTTFEERNTAVGFYTFADDFDSQDLQDEEIVPDYFRFGGPENLRRDASIEEITHLLHSGGIVAAYPDIQRRLEKATRAAIDRKLFRPWDGLPGDSFSHEYLTIGLEIVYGGRQRTRFMGRILDAEGKPQQPSFRLGLNNEIPLTALNLKKYDPELFEIVQFLFPAKDQFFAEMGWGRP